MGSGFLGRTPTRDFDNFHIRTFILSFIKLVFGIFLFGTPLMGFYFADLLSTNMDAPFFKTDFFRIIIPVVATFAAAFCFGVPYALIDIAQSALNAQSHLLLIKKILIDQAVPIRQAKLSQNQSVKQNVKLESTSVLPGVADKLFDDASHGMFGMSGPPKN